LFSPRSSGRAALGSLGAWLALTGCTLAGCALAGCALAGCNGAVDPEAIPREGDDAGRPLIDGGIRGDGAIDHDGGPRDGGGAVELDRDDGPWFSEATTVRERWVAPDGDGDGTREDPMALAQAIATAEPGDLVWLLEGTYRGTDALRFERDGTEELPVVFRAAPGARATVVPRLEVNAAHTWIWGLEITDPDLAPGGSTVAGPLTLAAPGARAINNYIHAVANNGIAAWNQGPGQVVYGNVIDRPQRHDLVNHPHNIYTQNDFAQHGHKYIVNNIILDADDPATCPVGNCFGFHAYAEGNYVTGLYLRRNVIRRGQVLLGGYNVPADHEVVVENYFYRADLRFGYRRPAQAECRDNYLVESMLRAEWLWGEGETMFEQDEPNVFTGNTVLTTGTHARVRTSAYLEAGRSEGGPRLRTDDRWNNNRYSSPMRAELFVDGEDHGTVDLSEWRRLTEAAGNPFDAAATEIPMPTGPHVVVLPNAYERGRAHVAIFGWSGAEHVEVDLSRVVPAGQHIRIRRASDYWGAPPFEGVPSGPVSLPTLGEALSVFVATPE
jgi:hypothetical protein